MPKGKYKVGPPMKKDMKGKCRVVGCRYYHFQLKNLQKHIQKAHKMMLTEHNKLPISSSEHITRNGKNERYLKYRKIEYCLHERCYLKHNAYSDLSKHIRKQHGLSRKQYNQPKDARTSVIKKENETFWSLQTNEEQTANVTDRNDRENSSERSILATSEDEALNGSAELFTSCDSNDEET